MLVMAIKAGSYADGAHINGSCRFIEVGHLYGDEERDFLSPRVSRHHARISHLSGQTASAPNKGRVTLPLGVG